MVRNFHFVLASPIGVEATRKDVSDGLRPRHFMLALAARLDGGIHEPEPASARAQVFHKALKTPPALISLAGRVVRESHDDDVIFCNSEAIALPVAHSLLQAKRRTRLASFGHNLYRPRISLSKLLSRAFARVDRFYVISGDQLRDRSRQSLFLEQIDDRFFTPADPGQVPAPGSGRPLIVSVGLDQRDYTT